MKKKKNLPLAILVATYWKEITSPLLKECLSLFKEKGISEKEIDIFRVPGALEIPLLAKKLAKKKKYKALIALGCVLKGETFHFEQVSIECVKGCQRVAYDFEIPVIFEVLSVFSKKQAKERIKKRAREAVETCLKMIEILEKI